MSKVMVIPDSHLKIDVIKDGLAVADKLRADYVVLLGDYFDDFYAMPIDYDNMIKYLRGVMRRFNIIPLIGNHELSYMGYPCAGHNRAVAKSLGGMLKRDHRFLVCVGIDGILYSHAGVTRSWIKEHHICTDTEMRHKVVKSSGAKMLEDRINGVEHWGEFAGVGQARGGRATPSPMWADLTELIADPIKIKQVVGHTPVQEIQCIGNCWFVDTYSNNNPSEEYLFVDNGSPIVVNKTEVLNG